MTGLEARVRGCVAALHDMTGIDDGSDLIAALGLDSLDIVELEAELCFALDVEIDLTRHLEQNPGPPAPLSVQGLTELVTSSLEEA